MEDKEKFQKNVEVVSKALKEQAGVREPEEEAKSLYRKFVQTRQEPVRLAVAPERFFPSPDQRGGKRGLRQVFKKPDPPGHGGADRGRPGGKAGNTGVPWLAGR